MKVESLLAQMTVSDLETAVGWYARLFGRKPDSRPMDGLTEWHLDGALGVQVYEEPDRAGHSTMVLGAADLAAVAQELDRAGIGYVGPHNVTATRILSLSDPDGNRVIFAGA